VIGDESEGGDCDEAKKPLPVGVMPQSGALPTNHPDPDPDRSKM